MSKLSELQSKRNNISSGGGEKMINAQHNMGKKTARERLDMLFDEGSFIEICGFVTQRYNAMDTNDGVSYEGVVCGYGTVDGRLVYAYAQDYTVLKGSVGEMHTKKIIKTMDMAASMGAPVVGIFDSDGARIEEGLDALCGFGEIFKRCANSSGVIPQIAVVLGNCAGGTAFIPAMSDFTFMTEKISRMFVNGPSVIKGDTNKDITAENLGGAEVSASVSGNASVKTETEEDCFKSVRELLSYLPSNNLDGAFVLECTDDLNRISENLNTACEADYDVKAVISDICDNGEFFEVYKEYAKNIVTGFARFNGMPVGIVANNGELLDGKVSEKGARFVRFCDSFNIPVVSLTDVSGFVADMEQEQNGLARQSAKLAYAFAEATVPKINIILKNAYGSAYLAMNSKQIGADLVYAWQGAEISVIGADTAATLLFDDYENAKNSVDKRQKNIAEYKEKYANPYVAASRGYIDDVIEAATTRPMIISALEMLISKREARPAKKHGNIPM